MTRLVCNNPFRQLPEEIIREISWMALEPTPTAKLMKEVVVEWRVFSPPSSDCKKCFVHAWRRQPWDVPWNPGDEFIFRIYDIPQDVEAGEWHRYSDIGILMDPIDYGTEGEEFDEATEEEMYGGYDWYDLF